MDTRRSPVHRCARLVEWLARRAETPPWHAVYRVLFGVAIVPTFRSTCGGGGGDWRLVPFLLLALLALRVVPGVVRRVLPFSDDACDAWARRRLLARWFDSYQWRKLLWIGAGLGASVAWAGQPGPVPAVLAVACVLAGTVGALRWRRIARTDAMVSALSKTTPPAAVARSAS